MSSQGSSPPELASRAAEDSRPISPPSDFPPDPTHLVSFGQTPLDVSRSTYKSGTPAFSPKRPIIESKAGPLLHTEGPTPASPFFSPDRSKSTVARVSLKDSLDRGRLSRLSQCDLIGRRNDTLVKNLTKLTDSLSQCRSELEDLTRSPSPERLPGLPFLATPQ